MHQHERARHERDQHEHDHEDEHEREQDQHHTARVLFSIFAIVFVGFSAVGAVMPVMPAYIRESLHAGDLAVAVLMGAESMTAILGRPYAGQFGGRWGWQRLLIVGSAIIAFAGGLYLIVSSVAGLLIARLILGVGAAINLTAGGAWTVEIVEPERRGHALGMYGLSMWSGFAIGPLIGDALVHRFSYQAVWMFAVAAPLLGLAIAAITPYHRRLTPPAPESFTLFPPPVVRPGIAFAMATLGYAVLFTFGVLSFNARGWSGGATALSCFGLMFVASRFVFGKSPDRLGPAPVATIAAVCEAVGLLLFAAAPTRAFAFVGAAIMGAGFSMVYPSLALFVVNVVEPEERGIAIGAFTAFFDLGIAASSVSLGPLAACCGYSAAFWAACAGAIAAALFARYGIESAARR
jgi:MFS family permease